MKKLFLLTAVLALCLTSCSTIRVNADYDKEVTFSQYKTYAYQKAAIDKAAISDLDKRRILRSIDEVMATKGFTKSETPDLIVSIFTQEKEQVDVIQSPMWGWGWGWGWGWSPWAWGGFNSVYQYVEGKLTIDFRDAKTKELIWQGVGEGELTQRMEKKDANIKEFVTKILEHYPPQQEKK
ncbi:protein of unknown function [Flavobacterium fontis]|uniref:DUF4136 domain-containing protein n=2 Tax=Flavobacterium TaxID=237 RepID=A0A1M5CYF8_9FLAO|nr:MULTISPECIES: DUF4136 domain-containing protein [Flavobacterium]MCZ8169429.1 DUF4136 domain-containing protein [Flavobacterium sp.]MCZ8295854.1 DUF4136 domain-containing protein [Flavobacterium sp.]SHF59750.1 protein of unknown function [Flavobacterium fontis]